MKNIVVKSNSKQVDKEWIPEGMVLFISGPHLTERPEYFKNIKFDTKKEADQYFMQAIYRKYKIAS